MAEADKPEENIEIEERAVVAGRDIARYVKKQHPNINDSLKPKLKISAQLQKVFSKTYSFS